MHKINRHITLNNQVWMELTPSSPIINPERIPFWTVFDLKFLDKVLRAGKWSAAADCQNGKFYNVYAMRHCSREEISNGYPQVQRLHCLIAGTTGGYDEIPDHQDGYGMNNLWANLVINTMAGNLARPFGFFRGHLQYPPEVLAAMFSKTEEVRA